MSLGGKVRGGQQAVTGSEIELYVAGTGGTGSAATKLISKTVTTSDGSGVVDSNANTGNANNTLPAGSFTITGDYTCPSADSQVYIIATGGNPGLAAGTNNTALAMMIALGSCGQLKPTTNLFIDEVTTVGSVAAIYPYATAYYLVGSAASEKTALAEEFSVASEYMDSAAGVAPGPNLPGGYYGSSTEIDTLADVLAACVNSTGGNATGGVSDGSNCGNFFLAAKPPTGNPPQDTIGAIIDILKNPTNNVSSIYGMQSSTPPFEPTLSGMPSDWTLPIVPLPQTPYASPVAGAYVAGQTVTLTNVTSGAAIHYTTDGSTPTASSMLYTSAISVPASVTIKALAVNRAGVSAAGTAAYTITGAPATPVITPAAGTYNSQQIITITSPTADTLVYATFDGTTPTTASLLVTGPLQLDNTETVRAIAVSGSSTSAGALSAYIYAPTSKTINTFAGGGTNSGATPATNVPLSFTAGAAVDLNGNLYIADSNSNVVRKLTVSTGLVTTVAGGGSNPATCSGSTDAYGDGCVATSATLYGPSEVAVDLSANLYIADSDHLVIRKVTAATGKITTIAGGGTSATTCSGSTDAYGDGCVATSAAFGDPSGVAVDAGGNVYVSDYLNNLVFKVTAATGILSIAAGGGSSPSTCSGSTDSLGDGCVATKASISGNFGIAVDGSGDLYIADVGDALIRKVTASTGVMMTVAGNGTAGYVASQNGGPATSAEINPVTIAVDASGDLYIADYGGYVREVKDSTGVITTVAGGGSSPATCSGSTDAYGNGCAATSASLGLLYSVAVDGSGNVYVGDNQSLQVREVTAAAGIITAVVDSLSSPALLKNGEAATSATLGNVQDVAVDGKGNVYIADQSSQVIREVMAGSGLITTVAGGGANPSTCSGSTDAVGDGCAATSATLNGPFGVALDASANVYIADTFNGLIRKVNAATGVITTVAGGGTSPSTCAGHTDSYGDGCVATSASLNRPNAVRVDGSGNLYLTDQTGVIVRKVTASTGVISTFAGGGSSPGTCSGHTDSSGDGCAATSASLVYATGLAVDGSGNVYIADYASKLVRKVTVATGVITLAAGGATSPLSNPEAVLVDASGNVYISDVGASVVRKVAVGTGIMTTVAGNGTAGFAGDLGPATSAEVLAPDGLAFDANGVLYIADTDNYRVRVVYP